MYFAFMRVGQKDVLVCVVSVRACYDGLSSNFEHKFALDSAFEIKRVLGSKTRESCRGPVTFLGYGSE